MTETDKKAQNPASHSKDNGKELSPEELDRLNFERKLRDQEVAGRKITPWHINIAAVVLCLIGLLYAIPRMLWISIEEESSYIPLSEREVSGEIDILPPIADEQQIPANGGADADGPGGNVNASPNAAPPDAPGESARGNVATPVVSSLTTRQKNIEELLPESEIINTLEQWARDWSAQNVDGYISHYASSFVSENGQDLQAWREYRSSRITSPEWVEVDLADMEITVTDSENAQADFLQTYTASNHSEESIKRLILIRESGLWKINRELSVDI